MIYLLWFNEFIIKSYIPCGKYTLIDTYPIWMLCIWLSNCGALYLIKNTTYESSPSVHPMHSREGFNQFGFEGRVNCLVHWQKSHIGISPLNA